MRGLILCNVLLVWVGTRRCSTVPSAQNPAEKEKDQGFLVVSNDLRFMHFCFLVRKQ